MALNLWNELKASVTGDTVDRIAAVTGENADATRRGLLGGALPAVLAGVTERFSGETGAARLLDEARAADPDGSMLDDFPAAVSRGGGRDMTERVGQNFLGTLFGPRTDTVADVVAGHAGIRKSSALTLLALAGPLLLGFLSRRARTGGLDAAGLASSLRDLRGQIPGIAPPGLTSALGLRGEEVRHAHEAPMAVAAAGRPKWLPWVIAALAVLALLALMRTCRKTAEPPPVAPVTEPAPVTTPVAPATPAAVAINLPDGTVLNLQPDSLTHGLAVYLADPAGAPPPRRFTFKNLTFDTSSNALDAASQATINDLTAILKAYPNAVVAIEGHTDNVGEPAANLELSKRRAEAVRDALYAKGIAKERVSGVGYGETKPVAPNDTEAGRAQNRRTDLVVTKK